ncbi:MAG: type II secretion system protein [Candidatus Aerophobetes bacterium]|nr:type II secretion system protein [Candidatus Aerophobetes bacterium]
MSKKYPKNQGKSGFTLVEVIVAVAILAFVIFATWRVVTSSIGSITRQGKRIKALHIGQACLGRLEGETFSKGVPENWVIDSGLTYQLSIYKAIDDLYPSPSSAEVDKIFINSDDSYWYSSPPDGLGFSDDNEDDGILVADKDGNIYTKSPSPSTQQYTWSKNNLTLTFASIDEGEKVQIYYRHYHLIDEGSTPRLYKPLYAPLGSSEDGSHDSKDNPYIVKLINFPVEKEIVSDMSGVIYSRDSTSEDIPPPEPNTPSDDYTINLSKGLLSFDDEDESVWITYLPERATTDVNNDGYQDPTDDSIVGVAEGSFWDSNSGATTTAVTPTKRITVHEFWKQKEKIREVKPETFVQK